MTCNVSSYSKGKRVEKTVIEDVEDYVEERLYSDFSKAVKRVLYKTDNGKAGVLLMSKLVYLIEKVGVGFHSEDLAGHLQKVDLNESGSLDRFDFMRWYVVEEASMESADEAERLVGWGCKTILIYLQ